MLVANPSFKNSVRCLHTKFKYKKWIPGNFHSHQNAYDASYLITRNAFVIPKWIFLPVVVGLVALMNVNSDLSLKFANFIKVTDKFKIQPRVDKMKELNKIPWFKRLNPENTDDYNEIKIIVKAAMSKDDTEKFEILNGLRPWEVEKRKKTEENIQIFMEYPNYYKMSVKEAILTNENNE